MLTYGEGDGLVWLACKVGRFVGRSIGFGNKIREWSGCGRTTTFVCWQAAAVLLVAAFDTRSNQSKKSEVGCWRLIDVLTIDGVSWLIEKAKNTVPRRPSIHLYTSNHPSILSSLSQPNGPCMSVDTKQTHQTGICSPLPNSPIPDPVVHRGQKKRKQFVPHLTTVGTNVPSYTFRAR